MTNGHHNLPNAPTNTPTVVLSDEGRPPNPSSGQGAGNATAPGPNSGAQGLDSADPHPAEEAHPYDARHPGGPTRQGRTSAPILQSTTAVRRPARIMPAAAQNSPT